MLLTNSETLNYIEFSLTELFHNAGTVLNNQVRAVYLN